jgi:hypothetical protein
MKDNPRGFEFTLRAFSRGHIANNRIALRDAREIVFLWKEDAPLRENLHKLHCTAIFNSPAARRSCGICAPAFRPTVSQR